MRVQVNQDSSKLSGTHHILVYAYDNILGGSVHTTKKNTAFLVVPSKEFCLEVSADTNKNMVRSRDQNAGKNYNIKINNTSIERIEEFKYLGTTITHQKTIQDKVKCRLKSGNICYYSAQNLLSSSLLFKTTGLFISLSGTSELDCATTKKDRAERSISIGRESLKFFLY